MAKEITLKLDADLIVRITEDHGGYHAGKCIACNTNGWVVNARHGYPYGSKTGKKEGNGLNHKKECPMNTFLNDDGTLK